MPAAPHASTSFTTFTRPATALGLLLAAGHACASHAAVFVFSQQCATPNWTAECTGTPCVPTGTQTFNNWGVTGCAAGLARPGALDTADISNDAVTLSSSINVLDILTGPSTTFTWTAGGITVAAPTTFAGTVSITGGARTIAGPITNTGQWTEDTAGAALSLSTSSLTNAPGATWTNLSTNYARVGSSANSFTNNGTWRKQGPASAALSVIPVTQAGTLLVEEGTLTLTGAALTFGASSTTTVSPGATLAITSPALSGPLAGVNSGTINLSTTSLAADATLAVTGNPVRWTTGNLGGAGRTLTIAPGSAMRTEGGVDRSFTGLDVVNNGAWTDDTGGFTTFFSTADFTNNGSLTLVNQNWSRFGSSTNIMTNNGTLTKTGAAVSTLTSLTVAHNGALQVLDGGLTFSSGSLTAGPLSTTTVASGAALTLAGPTAGQIEGVSNGTINLSGMSLGADLTINAGPGETHLLSTSTSLNFDTLTLGPATNFRNLTPVTKSFGSGTIVNNGDWLEATGGFATFFSTVSITNNGTITLDNHNWSRFGSSSNFVTNNGTLRKVGNNPATLTQIGLTNNGLLDVQAGSFARAGTFSFVQNPGGETRVRKGASATLANALWQGGTISGLGTLAAPFTLPAIINPITIRPGDPDDEGGTLTLQGNATFNSNYTFDIRLDARPGDPQDTDRVFITGQYQLNNAALLVSLADGFIPTLGDQYVIVQSIVAQPFPSTFGPVTFDVPPGVDLTVAYLANAVVLTVNGTTCDSVDFNRDGVFPDDADLADFLLVLSGGSCPTCNDVDFNNDGVFPDDQDLADFLFVLSGGSC